MADKIDEFDQRKLAHDYAWNWFQYHAGQRINLFRFYLIIFGGVSAGITTLFSNNLPNIAAILSFTIPVFSILFWRLDVRSADLIKIAERYLLESELYFSKVCGDRARLTFYADSKDNAFAKANFPNFLFSFRKTMHLIFLLCGVAGVVIGVVLLACSNASPAPLP